MRKPWPFVAAGLLLLASGSAGAQEASLSGVVRGEPRVQPKAGGGGGAYADRSMQYVKLFDYKHLRNVVVYAVPADGAAPPAGGKAAPDIRVSQDRNGARMEPAFLVAETEVSFKNKTRDSVTLYAASGSPAPLSLKLEAGEEKKVRLEALGFYRVVCFFCSQTDDDPPETKLFVAGPYSGAADSEGRYSFKLPAGRYQVTAWHERLPARTQEVELKPGESHELSFTLSVKQLPPVP